MRGVFVESKGAPWKIESNLQVPEVGEDQILVKSIWTAINPVDAFIANMGLLVDKWPVSPGCDAGGEVVKVGKNAISPLGEMFKVGDKVFGCTRLSFPWHSPYLEYFLMDAKVTVPVPPGLSLDKACTLGVATYTAGLAVFDSMKIEIPDPKHLPDPHDGWALVLGGSSSVGKATINILKACGYKVLATASPHSFELMKKVGANDCVSYKQDQDKMIAEIVEKTDGKLTRVFDAVAQNVPLAVPLSKALTSTEPMYFSSTDDWDPAPAGIKFNYHPVSLGPVGRPNAPELNDKINKFIPFVYEMVKSGHIQPAETVKIGNTLGLDVIPEAYEFQQSGKGGSKKVIVQIAEE